MPISPVSPFEIINIVRSGGLINAADASVDFNIAVTGVGSNDWAALNTAVQNLQSGGAVTIDGDVNWAGLITAVPVGAIISEVKLFARVGYSLASALSAQCQPAEEADGECSSYAAANVHAPDTLNVPILTPDVFIVLNESNQSIANNQQNISLSSNLSGNAVLRTIWDFSGEPGGGISRVTLVARFTEVRIQFTSISAYALWSRVVGIGISTGEEDASVGSGTINTWGMLVTWTYIYQWTMTPPDMSGVQAGDLVTITSTGVNALLLNQLTVDMGGPIVPIIQTPNLLTFLVPPGLPDGLTPVIATGNGTQFAGSIPLGTLEVIGANVSGIYVLDAGVLNDSLYSSARDGSVTIRAIPNPFLKTGFIGG